MDLGLGSARVSRAGGRPLAFVNFSSEPQCSTSDEFQEKVRFGGETSTRGRVRSPELLRLRCLCKIAHSRRG